MAETEEERRTRKAKERAERHGKSHVSESERHKSKRQDSTPATNNTIQDTKKEETNSEHDKKKTSKQNETKDERKARKEREHAEKHANESQQQEQEEQQEERSITNAAHAENKRNKKTITNVEVNDNTSGKEMPQEDKRAKQGEKKEETTEAAQERHHHRRHNDSAHRSSHGHRQEDKTRSTDKNEEHDKQKSVKEADIMKQAADNVNNNNKNDTTTTTTTNEDKHAKQEQSPERKSSTHHEQRRREHHSHSHRKSLKSNDVKEHSNNENDNNDKDKDKDKDGINNDHKNSVQKLKSSENSADARRMELLAAIAAENERVKHANKGSSSNNNNNNNDHNNKPTHSPLGEGDNVAGNTSSITGNINLEDKQIIETSEQRRERRRQEREARRSRRANEKNQEQSEQEQEQQEHNATKLKNGDAANFVTAYDKHNSERIRNANQPLKSLVDLGVNKVIDQSSLTRQGYREQYTKDLERGLMLRRLIDLDELSVVIYDAAPQSSYDLYLANFRSSGKVQAATQVPNRDDTYDIDNDDYRNIADRFTYAVNNNASNDNKPLHGTSNYAYDENEDEFSLNNIAIQVDRIKTKNKSIQAPNDLGLYPESSQTTSIAKSTMPSNTQFLTDGKGDASRNEFLESAAKNIDPESTKSNLRINGNNFEDTDVTDKYHNKSFNQAELINKVPNNNNNSNSNSNCESTNKNEFYLLPSLRLFLKRAGRVMNAVLNENVAMNEDQLVTSANKSHDQKSEEKNNTIINSKVNNVNNDNEKSVDADISESETSKRVNTNENALTMSNNTTNTNNLNLSLNLNLEGSVSFQAITRLERYNVTSRPVIQIEEIILIEEQLRRVFVLFGAEAKRSSNNGNGLGQFSSLIVIYDYSLSSEKWTRTRCSGNDDEKIEIESALICTSYNTINCIAINACLPHVLVAGGVDGCVMMWDLHDARSSFGRNNGWEDNNVYIDCGVNGAASSTVKLEPLSSNVVKQHDISSSNKTSQKVQLTSCENTTNHVYKCEESNDMPQQICVRLPSCATVVEPEMLSMVNAMDVNNEYENAAESFTIVKIVFLSHATRVPHENGNIYYSDDEGKIDNYNSVTNHNNFQSNVLASERAMINEQLLVLRSNGHVHQLCLTEEIHNIHTSGNSKSEGANVFYSTFELREQRLEHNTNDVYHNDDLSSNVNNEYHSSMKIAMYDDAEYTTTETVQNRSYSATFHTRNKYECYDLEFFSGDSTQYMIATSSGVQHRSRFARVLAPTYYGPPQTINKKCERVYNHGPFLGNGLMRTDAFMLTASCLSVNVFDRQLFLAGYQDGSIRLFCTTRSKPLLTFINMSHTYKIKHIEWNPSSKWLFTALDEKGTLSFYDIAIKSDRQSTPVFSVVTNDEWYNLPVRNEPHDEINSTSKVVKRLKNECCTYFHYPTSRLGRDEINSSISNESTFDSKKNNSNNINTTNNNISYNGKNNVKISHYLMYIGYKSGRVEHVVIDERNVKAKLSERSGE